MKRTTKAEDLLTRLKHGTGADSDMELANMLGISQQSISSARAKVKVPDSWVRKAAERFNLNTDWLFFGTGPMRPGEEAPAAQAPSSTPQETGSIAAQGARVALLEEVLKAKEEALRAKEEALRAKEEALRAKEELLKAKDETLAAYKQALDTMRELALMGGPTTTGAPPCAPPAPSPNHASK